MIQINLLPELLRAKIKKEMPELPIDKIIYLVPVLFALLVASHIALTAIFISSNYAIAGLNNGIAKLKPQLSEFDSLRNDYIQVSGNGKDAQLVSQERINWAEKLGRLSSGLPGGIWFTELVIKDKNFRLSGSVISLQKEELALVNKFMETMHQDKSFFRDFEKKFELSSVNRRQIGNYEIVDFTLIGAVK